ncbi:MAG TPA: serine hydrolase domain-containing protein, partial [Gemmatimonadaceae bacterium]|nr:serine hydrolase domain-containing protein [Gemmatimonadaceae bacterium]
RTTSAGTHLLPPSAAACALPTATPESVGLSSAALDSFAITAKDRMSDALVILRDGQLVGEWYFGRGDHPVNIQSISKAITSLGVALLLDDGRIPSLDLPVGDVLPEFASGDKRALTLNMLMNHTSGVASGQGEGQFAGVQDIDAFVRSRPLAEPPGSVYRYSNVNAQLAAAIVEVRAGQPVATFVRDRVFVPLCITDFQWTGDAKGHTYGYSRLSLHARDLAKLGQLVLGDGTWRGQRVISAATMRRVTDSDGGRMPFAAGNYTHFWQVAAADSVLVDAMLVEHVRAAGASASFIDALHQFVGHTWPTAVFKAKLDTALGTNGAWARRWYDETHGAVEPIRTRGPARVILHSGSWGQYLIIFPATRTVVVRFADFSHPGRTLEDDAGAWGSIAQEAYDRFGKAGR